MEDLDRPDAATPEEALARWQGAVRRFLLGGALAAVACAEAPPATPFDPATATAILEVRTLLRGTPPRMRDLDFSSDVLCAGSTAGPVRDPTVAVREGRLANATVWVSRGAERWSYAIPERTASLVMEAGMLEPHVFTIQAGQRLSVTAEGRCTLHLHAVPRLNPEIHRTLRREDGPFVIKFPAEELGIRFRCDVHSWMLAWGAVFEHPFHGVTDDRGVAFLRLPPGEFEVSVWHEFEGFRRPGPRTVVVADGDTPGMEFVFEAPKGSPR